MSIGKDLLNVPFGDMVMQLANAIAEGQFKMDMASCKIAKLMGDVETCGIEIPNFGDSLTGSETVSLIGAGFQPTFYQFTDTIIEVKISISTTMSVETSASVGFTCSCASVNASFSAKYSYSAEGSSLIRTKITPVPPNAFMSKLLDLKAQLEQKKFEKTLQLIEQEIAKETSSEENKPASNNSENNQNVPAEEPAET
ncbi:MULTISPECIES: hypothetical protein [unclassified Fibrobacter]|uniref:hypothetical protein n=1 Tax=unclassified Fibrobacter TaxID=2634177 RepID=UPI00091189A5|nr:MULTISPECIES: hypothetical protein [Fibrobacter]MCQ2100046.1 hypothetical protein [Fibrobacter sp.]MCL4102508.1 hypothetical protein [Fibrobacter succinogenes]OWV08108.1 hypothetical protein B7993_00255 [Fibrobacter sp. UWH3]OWV13551.1 hypothetical protein B7992_08320 [Fibrobacter sp. UWH1]SHK71159.1 hypothetical protein SAMN05720765_104180 [Fibrobacter sp. UWH6]